MTRIQQLRRELDKLTKAHTKAHINFADPLYIAWQIDCIFDGKAPPPEIQDWHKDIMKARQSTIFREFWNAYKNAKIAMDNFQSVNMGVIAKSTMVAYTNRFRKEHPEEVPF